MKTLANGWNVGGMVMFGSASDEPFAALRDMTFTTAGFMNVPARNRRDAWNFSLFYSPTSQLPFPIPGVAYVWRPSSEFEATIGLPPSIRYRPTDRFTLSASCMPLTNFRVCAEQQLADDWAVYASYQAYNETYFLADRTEDDQRFYVFDQRTSIGLKRKICNGFMLDFSAAYLFDRQLFQGFNFSQDREDVLKFDPGMGLTLQLIWAR